MQKIAIVVTLVVLFGTHASAQEVEEGLQRTGTVFGALGGTSDGTAPLFHVGAGEDVVWPNGLGVGADVGYISSTTDFGEGLFLLTAGPIYEFQTGRRYKPFVRGGVSLVLGEGGALSLMHFGGGIDQWFDERWGLRLEVRDHLHPRYPGFQVVEFTVGLLIRQR